jgi:protein-tyrosine-phosphatase
LVTPEALSEADVVVVMDPGQLRRLRGLGKGIRISPVVVLGDLDPQRNHRRAIRDPWGCEPAVFDDVFERIDRCVAELVLNVASGARRGAEVRQGPERTDSEADPCTRTTSR